MILNCERPLIVCSCNVLSDTQILATLQSHDGEHPSSPGRAYRCLGCAPRCGRCVATVRALLIKAHVANCEVGCPACPAQDLHRADDVPPEEPVFLIAAE
jgi:bacterioferritin-associated ferredoxin